MISYPVYFVDQGDFNPAYFYIFCQEIFGFKIAKKFPDLIQIIEGTDDVTLKQKQSRFDLEEIKQFFSQTNFSNKWNLVKVSIVIVVYFGGTLITREQVAAITLAG